MAGSLRILPTPEKRDFFASNDLTVEDISRSMSQFVDDVENGLSKEKAWPSSCYGTSKLGVIALTKVLGRVESNPSSVGIPIKFYSCCPGYCATDMSSHGGPKSAEEGARTPFMLATLDSSHPFSTLNGEYFTEESLATW
jgi:carbonyl reductase 1